MAAHTSRPASVPSGNATPTSSNAGASAPPAAPAPGARALSVGTARRWALAAEAGRLYYPWCEHQDARWLAGAVGSPTNGLLYLVGIGDSPSVTIPPQGPSLLCHSTDGGATDASGDAAKERMRKSPIPGHSLQRALDPEYSTPYYCKEDTPEAAHRPPASTCLSPLVPHPCFGCHPPRVSLGPQVLHPR